MKPSLQLVSFLFLLLVNVTFQHANGQATGWLWGRNASGSGIDAYAVATDASGNVYGAGVNFGNVAATFGTITLPNSPVPGTAGGLGDLQALWVKYSSTGTPLWADGTQNADAWLYNITADPSGNLIVFGSFDSPTMTLGSTTLTNAYGTSGDNQYFIAKYSPTGTLLWAICDGSSPNTYHYLMGFVCILTTGAITTDAAGNIYVTSSFQQPSITIGSTTLTNADPSGATSDIFVAKYNSSGVLQWAKRAGGNSDDFAYGIAMGSAGKIYVTGPFWSSTLSIGSSTISNPYGTGGYGGFVGGTPLAYIAEFSSTGIPTWAEAAGGSNGAYAMGTVTDASGNVYITGGFGDASITLGGTTITRTYPGAAPNLALFLAQYSPAHTVSWGKTIGSSTAGVWGFAIALAACGEVWVSGNYSDTANIDGHILAPPLTGDPVFIAGYNLSGAVLGYSGLASGGDDQNGIACDQNGNVFICSDYYGGSLTVGPDVLPTPGLSDEWFYIGKYANIAIGTNDTTFHTTDTTLCKIPSLTLTATAGYTSYTWDNLSALQTRTVTASGDYWVVCVSSCSIPVTVDTFHVLLSLSDTSYNHKDTTVCSGSVSAMLYGDNDFTSYQWSTGATGTSVSVSNGTYWVREMNGCALRVDTFTVALGPDLHVNLGNDTSLCTGGTVTLHCSQPSGVSYNWSTGSIDTSVQVTTTGNYSLTVSKNGCTATDSVTVTFDQAPPQITLGPDTVLCDEPEFIIESGNDQTIWSNGKKGDHIIINYPGIYIASLESKCGITRDTIKVDFEHCMLTLPNAFTPNNDGRNDVFKVVGLQLSFFNNFSLSCYNRFGQQVFYSENVNDGWDGTFNGSPQDLGTYFYMVKYSLNGKSHMLKGDFELIR